MKQLEHLLKNYEHEMATLTEREGELIAKSNDCIHFANSYLNKLRVYIQEHEFTTEDQEIYFFKHVKPQVLSAIIYYDALIKMESEANFYAARTLLEYYELQLSRIREFSNENRDFIYYYKTGSTYKDQDYFTRKPCELMPGNDAITLQFDTAFCTPYDYKVAEMLAYERLAATISTNIAKRTSIMQNDESLWTTASRFHWTDNKVALVELIYALYSSKCINSGKVDISELASFFETHFNLELGDYYRRFLEIKARKAMPTKFLDHLKSSLLLKMQEELN